MALLKIQIEGEEARKVVQAKWPNATSRYIATGGTEVYDPETKTVLGSACFVDFPDAHAWLDASEKIANQSNG